MNGSDFVALQQLHKFKMFKSNMRHEQTVNTDLIYMYQKRVMCIAILIFSRIQLKNYIQYKCSVYNILDCTYANGKLFSSPSSASVLLKHFHSIFHLIILDLIKVLLCIKLSKKAAVNVHLKKNRDRKKQFHKHSTFLAINHFKGIIFCIQKPAYYLQQYSEAESLSRAMNIGLCSKNLCT